MNRSMYNNWVCVSWTKSGGGDPSWQQPVRQLLCYNSFSHHSPLEKHRPGTRRYGSSSRLRFIQPFQQCFPPSVHSTNIPQVALDQSLHFDGGSGYLWFLHVFLQFSYFTNNCQVRQFASDRKCIGNVFKVSSNLKSSVPKLVEY